MSSPLVVLIDDQVVGRVTRDRGTLRFAYDDAYGARSEPTPLSVFMPVDSADHAHRRIGPWLAGLLPDNDRVLLRWARHFQVGGSAFALLGTPVGEDCAGAARFVTEDRLEAALGRGGDVEWLDDARVAERRPPPVTS